MKKINGDLIRIFLSILLVLGSYIFKDWSFWLLIGSYVLSGLEVYFNAFKNIREGEIFDENLLMIIATIGAFYIGEYPEAVMVMLLFQIGEYLSDRAVDRSKEAITNLLDLRSDIIYLKHDKDIVKTSVDMAKVGDVFVVKPGELIPLDGKIIKGKAMVDTSSLTGEAIPQSKNVGEMVLSGTINLDGIIEVQAITNFKNSTASRIIEIIENSNESKTKTEKFITKFSKVYTPIVVVLALMLVLVPWYLGLDFNMWLYRALEFLVISCPCALVISVPLGYFCGIGKCSKEGILIKGGDTLDKLNNAQNVIFDKTGTLTKGVFKVTKIQGDKQILKLAAYADSFSNHPIASAILKEYKGKIDSSKIKDFKEISGCGIICKVDGEKIVLGTKELLIKEKIKITDTVKDIGTIIYVGKNKEYLGYIVVSDVIKEDARLVISELKKVGILKTYMLSGDDDTIVKKIANDLNIDEGYGSLFPQDKVQKLEEIKQNGVTLFVGDGINDAPVIKLADVGIAMGCVGSDAAIEAADMVLMHDELKNIIRAINIAKKTRKIVTFNIGFAIIFKFVMLLLAILGLTSIWMAVLADVGVTLLAILNDVRIMFKNV